jgi:hypothetical protein
MGQMGDSLAPTLFAWNVAQASDNYLELSELHDATTADYAGASPMVGFGSGAYLLSLLDRGATVAPACGDFASEPGGDSADGGTSLPDGGSITPGGPNPNDGGVVVSDGDTPSSGSSSSGCGCTIHEKNGSNWAVFAAFALGALSLVRRRR